MREVQAGLGYDTVVVEPPGDGDCREDAEEHDLSGDPRGSAPAVAQPARQRLAGLDGVRGLAALFVLVNNVFLRAFPGYAVDRAPIWAGWFIYRRFAVVVFIVLSGSSLALSPARKRSCGTSRAIPPQPQKSELCRLEKR